MGAGKDVPDDYFFVNGKICLDEDRQFLCFVKCFPALARFSPCPGFLTAKNLASASSVLLRQKILRKCREDIYHFFDRENGQVAIYDAVNPLAAGRRNLAKEFSKHDIQVPCFPRLLLSPGPEVL